jgi:hypothetical protein
LKAEIGKAEIRFGLPTGKGGRRLFLMRRMTQNGVFAGADARVNGVAALMVGPAGSRSDITPKWVDIQTCIITCSALALGPAEHQSACSQSAKC